MQLPLFFMFDGKRFQSVGAGTRAGAALYTDGRQNFVEAASAIIESAGPLFSIARCLVNGNHAVTVKISNSHYGARPPARGNVGLVLPQRGPDGKLFTRLWFPLNHSGRAETW